MHAPQIVMIVLLSLGVFRAMLKHGESDGTVNFATSAASAALMAGLLWWGGFFS